MSRRQRQFLPGGTLAPYLALFAAAPTADPGDVVNGSATVSAGRIDATLQNPGVVSRLPSAMGVWETTTLRDMRGQSLADADKIDLGDLLQVWLRGHLATLGVDRVIAAGLSTGTVNATNPGMGCMLEYTSTGNRVQHCANAGAGWAITNATAVSALSVWSVMQAVVGTASSQVRLNAYGADATKELIPTSNTMTAPGSFNVGTDQDRIWAGMGFATGVGGSAGAQGVGVNLLAQRPREVVYDPFS